MPKRSAEKYPNDSQNKKRQKFIGKKLYFYMATTTTTTSTRGVIAIAHIDVLLTLLKQYRLPSLFNTHINAT